MTKERKKRYEEKILGFRTLPRKCAIKLDRYSSGNWSFLLCKS
nr:MAG TPA: hypothetical protein [Inoviridae sp.]